MDSSQRGRTVREDVQFSKIIYEMYLMHSQAKSFSNYL